MIIFLDGNKAIWTLERMFLLKVRHSATVIHILQMLIEACYKIEVWCVCPGPNWDPCGNKGNPRRASEIWAGGAETLISAPGSTLPHASCLPSEFTSFIKRINISFSSIPSLAINISSAEFHPIFHIDWVTFICLRDAGEILNYSFREWYSCAEQKFLTSAKIFGNALQRAIK